MKKINQAQTLGGMPVNNNDLKIVFNKEIWDVLEAMLSPFQNDTEGVIISGVNISGGGPTYSFSEGIVYLNGEFMRFPSFNPQTLPKYIVAGTPVNDDRTFADTVTRTAFITKSATIQDTQPGSGQYIAITSPTDPDDRRWVNIFTNKQASNTFAEATIFQQTLEVLGGIRTESSGPYIKTELLVFSGWNMDVDSRHQVPHTIGDRNKIIGISVMLNSNAGIERYVLPTGGSDGVMAAWVEFYDNDSIRLERLTGGIFDSALFNAASGTILIHYTL